MLYDKGGYFDKAAAVYIRSKNWYVNNLWTVNLSSDVCTSIFVLTKTYENVCMFLTRMQWQSEYVIMLIVCPSV